MKRFLLSFVTLVLTLSLPAAAQVRFTPRDSVLSESILQRLSAREDLRSGEMLLEAGRSLLGTPYVAGTLDDTPRETLTVSLTRTDCILFVETCFNLTLCAQRREKGFYDLCNRIRDSRYREGVVGVYEDRIHYTTEWIRKGEARGLLQDLTLPLGGKAYTGHPINYMSTHPDKYPLLKDPGTIREAENRLNREPMTYIPKSQIAAIEQEILPGDIICFVTSIAGLDISHVALACIHDGKVGFLHASSTGHQVMIDPKSIAEYAASQRSCAGIKVVRMTEKPAPVRHTFTYDGRQREYWLYIPDNAPEGCPLVMVLHGYGGKAEGYRPEMMDVAREEGFAVCYPQGRKNAVGKTGWNVGYPTQKDLEDNDLALVSDLARRLQEEQGFSARNTFLTGMSNGGEMCYLTAWSADTTFTALASVAGLMMKWRYDGPAPTRAIPFLEIHGTADKTSHWEGDPEGKFGWGDYTSVPAAVAGIVSLDRCPAYERTVLEPRNPGAHRIILHRYSGGQAAWEGGPSCEVRLYEVEGGKHSWFMKDIDTCREIWDFFKQYLR